MDILIDALEHSWGKSPEQKAREKEYNAEYYRKHKEKWAKYRHDIGLGQNAYNSRYYTGKSMSEVRGEVSPSLRVKRARASEAAAENERDKLYWNAYKQEERYAEKERRAAYKEAAERLFSDAPHMLSALVDDVVKGAQKAIRDATRSGKKEIERLKKSMQKPIQVPHHEEYVDSRGHKTTIDYY